jgi:Ca2+-binding RTX toxin-like protein
MLFSEGESLLDNRAKNFAGFSAILISRDGEGIMAIKRGTNASETLRGTSGADSIFGYGGNDILHGYGGNDLLNGGWGADTMYGGGGDDVYIVNSLSDQAIESAGNGYDTVRTSGHYALAFDSSIERLTTTDRSGTAPLDLFGNNFANRIEGNAGENYMKGYGGADTLLGFSGDDVLLGYEGRDRLTGGEGNDTFVFTDLSRDRITDFTSGSDVIDLGWIASEADFEFIGGEAFSGAAGEGRFENGVFELDLDGDAQADFSISINGTVTATDFSFAALGYWDY